jgi:small-conductance mechanosensitive channel
MIEYFGNTLNDYATALGVFVGLLIFFALFQKILLGKLKKIAEDTKSDVDDELIQIVRTIKPPFYSFLAFYLSLGFLLVNAFLKNVINAILIVWFVFQIITALQILINFIVRKRFSSEDTQVKTAVNAVSMIMKIALWTIALLLILSNLGVNITSLVAGLGIGGIAVAMALNNILKDLFDSFAIYFDKPFLVGDFIAAGSDIKGTVEKIGLKTTRLKAPQGEEIVVANSKLTAAKIQNFRKLEERRVTFSLGVAYETPTGKLKKIPKILKEIIEPKRGARFDRAHFTKFADFALVFDVVYFVESSEYQTYLDINQKINFEIKEEFEKEGISMAYPTQTLFVEKKS